MPVALSPQIAHDVDWLLLVNSIGDVGPLVELCISISDVSVGRNVWIKTINEMKDTDKRVKYWRRTGYQP